MLLHGIQAVTIAGRKDENAGTATSSKQNTQKLLSLFNVVEAGLRSSFAYDS